MTADRWLYGWAMGYAAVGAASLLVPFYAFRAAAALVAVGAALAALAPGARTSPLGAAAEE